MKEEWSEEFEHWYRGGDFGSGQFELAYNAWMAGEKNAAHEILTQLIIEETRRIIAVGDPRQTTVASGMLSKLVEMKLEYS